MFRPGSIPWNKGLKKTQSANKGSFRKGEHRGEKTEFVKGADPTKHWNWKGGITKIQDSVRTSSEYKKWRKAVFEKDDYTCIWCGKKGGLLEADHIQPFAYFPELRLTVSNGRTLCKQCHQFTASYMGRIRLFNQPPKEFLPGKTRIEYGGALIGAEEIDAVMRTILSQGGKRWTMGAESVAFEQELAAKTGVAHAIVTNSGSSALLVALTALHLPKGSRVLIPALNFPTAFNAILQVGCVPYVIDCDIETLNLNLDEVQKAMDEQPRYKIDDMVTAVIAVNIASNPVDLVKLREIVGKDVKIVLDNCDGYGTLVRSLTGGDAYGEGASVQMVFPETLADVACVSFHAAHIITTGEGGACLTSDPEIASRCVKLREWGRASGSDTLTTSPDLPSDYRERYVYDEIGYNVKPLELQCAMGRVQLRRLEEFKAKRLANYAQLYEYLRRYPQLDLIDSPDDASVCWFSFPLLCRGVKRADLMAHLEANNIECRTIFSGNILRHPAYKDTIHHRHTDTMVNADDVMKNGMFLSVHPSITLDMITFIDRIVGEVCRK